MGYYVRLLTSAESVIPFNEIQSQVNTVTLTRGTDVSWEQIEVLNTSGDRLAVLERLPVSTGRSGESELALVKEKIRGYYPLNAREWLKKYLENVKTIYSFQLATENIKNKTDWLILGRVQNLLKDALIGIIQADSEGFYNENGDYILWQMYPGAGGSIPAASLNEEGEWIPFQLKLDDDKAVERFKQGETPKKSLMDILFRR